MKKVLFICAENAGRSQISEAFFNHLKPSEEWVAESAGTIPAKEVNPVVVSALKEIDISITNKAPTLFEPSTIDSYEKVISFGCLVKEFFSPEIQSKIEEWDIDDPKGKPIEEVRKIRDEIKTKVLDLIERLSK